MGQISEALSEQLSVKDLHSSLSCDNTLTNVSCMETHKSILAFQISNALEVDQAVLRLLELDLRNSDSEG
jgi:hypothetical protein